MNAEQLRKDIFALMLRQSTTHDLNELVATQWEIEEKIEPLVSLTGLNKETIESLLAVQYAAWRQAGGGSE